MAVIETAQAGNRNVGSTWVGGNVPGAGDVADLRHPVTCDAADGTWLVGDAADGRAIVCGSAAGALTVTGNAANLAQVAIEALGNIEQGSGQITFNDGAILEFNPGSGENFAYRPGTQHTLCGGTGSRPVLIRKKAGALGTLYWGLGTASGQGGVFLRKLNGAGFCRLSGFGDSSNGVFGLVAPSGGTRLEVQEAAQDIFEPPEVEFDACGRVYVTQWGIPSNIDVHVDGWTVKNSVSSSEAFWLDGESSATAAPNTPDNGIRRNWLNVSVDARFQLRFMPGYTMDDLTVYELRHSAHNLNFASAKRWLIRNSQGPSIPAADEWEMHYFMSESNNSHGYALDETEQSFDGDGYIFHPLGTGGAETGDGLLTNSAQPAALTVVNLENYIAMQNRTGGTDPVALTVNGTNNGNLQVNLSKFVFRTSDTNASIVLAEAGNAGANAVSLQDGIFHGDPGAAHAIEFKDSDTPDACDQIANCGHHNIDTTGANGIADVSMTTAPGPLVTGDPQFVDDTRDVISYATSLGLAGTVDGLFQELLKLPSEPGRNASATVEGLFAHIYAGYVPQAASYLTASSTGGPIGVQAAAQPSVGSLPVMVGRSALVH